MLLAARRAARRARAVAHGRALPSAVAPAGPALRPRAAARARAAACARRRRSRPTRECGSGASGRAGLRRRSSASASSSSSTRAFRQAVLGGPRARRARLRAGRGASAVRRRRRRAPGRADRAESRRWSQARDDARNEPDRGRTPRRGASARGLRERSSTSSSSASPRRCPLSARGDDPAARERLVAQARGDRAGGRAPGRPARRAGRRLRPARRGSEARRSARAAQAVFGPAPRLPLAADNAAELGQAFGGSDEAARRRPARGALVAAGREPRPSGRLAPRRRRSPTRPRSGARGARAEGRAAAVRRRASAGSALPAPRGGFPPGKLSLVAHLPQPFQPAKPLAGLVLDEWVEIVPAARGDERLAFNYDAPGARPPQTLLLAGRAARARERWERRDAREDAARDARARAAARGRPAGARRATRSCSARCRPST